MLFLSEKPSVGREIAATLGGEWESQDGCLEGPEHIVTWARGHLLSLAEPEAYDPSYKRWRLEDLPIVPRRFELRPIRGAGKQIALIKKLLRRKDVSTVVNACDAGREGELIFAWIMDHCAPPSPTWSVERLWLSSLTEGAIREALGRLRPASEMADLERAARARAAADWVVGINGTRAASIRFRPVFDSASSIGRVQTPTLAMLVAREREIEAFASQPRFALEASFLDQAGLAYRGRWHGEVVLPEGASFGKEDDEDEDEALIDDEEQAEGAAEGEAQDGAAPEDVKDVGSGGGKGARPKEQPFLPSREEAERIKYEVEASEPATRKLFELTVEVVREAPPLPYDLTSLQREANKRWRYSAAKTLEVAQALYERHKAITYPRTDSRHLTEDIKASMPGIFVALASFPSYGALASPLVALGPALPHPTRPYDDARVSDHHAILPTAAPTFKAFFSDQAQDPKETLPEDVFRIYDLIARRTLALYHPDAVSRSLRAHTACGEDAQRHVFLTRAKGLVEPGWRAVYGRVPQPEKVPDLAEGPVTLEGLAVVESESKPPRRHSEGTLLKAMETAGREVSSPALREAMKRKGLGTPATRASIIERLISVGYVERRRGELLVTAKGRSLIDFVGAGKMASPDLTGDWEARLREIEEGRGDIRAFWRDIVAFASEVLAEVEAVQIPQEALDRAQEARREAMGPALGACPQCGEPMRRTPRAWSCWQDASEPGCGFAIWQEISERRISDEEAQALIERGRTDVLEGFKRRSGEAFSAALVVKRILGGSIVVGFELPA
jgi:DNA topoisomerase-3